MGLSVNEASFAATAFFIGDSIYIFFFSSRAA